MKLRARSGLLISAAAALLSGMVAASSPASANESDRTIIILPKEQQSIPQRPTLEAIKKSAARAGRTLAQEIDDYVAHKVATDPSVTARARADGLDPAVVEPEMRIDDLRLSELTDLKLAAKGNKISLEEAIETIAWQPRLNEIGARLEELFPNETSGLEIRDAGRKARIGFKGEIPSVAIELAKTLPVTVELVGNKGFSDAELKQARDTALSEVLSHRDLVDDASGVYDRETGVVAIDVKPRIIPSGAAARQAVGAQLQPTRPANAKIGVTIRLTEHSRVVRYDNYMRGGGQIVTTTNGNCTTGFNVINESFPTDPNSRRTTTAAHCGTSGTATYYNHSAQGGSTTSQWAGRFSTRYDIGSWTRGALALTRTFYYNTNQARYVYSTGLSPAVGQNICRYGASSDNANCANIQTTDYANSANAGIIIMDRATMIPGDSGGPWYKGNVAWGLTIGNCGFGGGAPIYDCFTWARFVPDAVGPTWRVWTAPEGT